MSRRSGSAGTGFGIAGVGCVLLVGFVGFAAVLICGGFGTSLWRSMPRVVEVDPPRPVAGTDPSPVEPEPEPQPKPVRRPRPRPRPRPTPVPEPEPITVEVENDTRIVADVSVAGDARAVVAIGSDGTAYPLPGSLRRGTYDLQVSFGGASFVAGSIAVLDGSPRTVTCRQSLGICKVR